MSSFAVDLLETSLTGLSASDAILKVKNVAAHLGVHAAFEDAPEHVPGPVKLLQFTDEMTTLVHAIADGASHRKQELKDLQANMERAVTLAAQHVIMVSIYRDDPTLLQNTGLELKQRNYTRHSDLKIPGQPAKFNAKHGRVSKTVMITVQSDSDVVSRELQVCDGDPSLESSWRLVGFYGKCKIEVTGLVPASTCHFRIRGINDAGAGPWSATVTLIIL